MSEPNWRSKEEEAAPPPPDPSAEEDPDSAKTNRKCRREKERRQALNAALQELACLQSAIDEPAGSFLETGGGASGRGQERSAAGHGAEGGLSVRATRLEIIGRTIESLRRLHGENLELKQALTCHGRSRSESVPNEGNEVDGRVQSISSPAVGSTGYLISSASPNPSFNYHPEPSHQSCCCQDCHYLQTPMTYRSSYYFQYDYHGYTDHTAPHPWHPQESNASHQLHNGYDFSTNQS